MAGHRGSGFASGARSANTQRVISSICSGWRIPRGLDPHQRPEGVRPRLARPHPQVPGGAMFAGVAPELPVRDEARRPHPRFEVQEHPDVLTDEFWAGDALYEADGPAVGLPDLL